MVMTGVRRARRALLSKQQRRTPQPSVLRTYACRLCYFWPSTLFVTIYLVWYMLVQDLGTNGIMTKEYAPLLHAAHDTLTSLNSKLGREGAWRRCVKRTEKRRCAYLTLVTFLTAPSVATNAPHAMPRVSAIANGGENLLPRCECFLQFKLFLAHDLSNCLLMIRGTSNQLHVCLWSSWRCLLLIKCTSLFAQTLACSWSEV